VVQPGKFAPQTLLAAPPAGAPHPVSAPGVEVPAQRLEEKPVVPTH
jgi:hypothetical protein